MMHTHEIRFIVGVIGNVISAFLFLSAAPTVWRIVKNKSTEELHPYPYLCTVMNCVLWLFYGTPIVHPGNTLVATINGFGLFIELLYVSIFFYYTNNKKNYRIIIPLTLLAEAVAFAAVAGPTLLAAHTHEERSMIVGTVCVVYGIVMYGPPLSVVRKMIKTKSVEFLPVDLCLVGFVNGLVWFAYAFLSKKIDPYIAIPNGAGAVLGFIQLCTYCYYTTRRASEVQLHNKLE